MNFEISDFIQAEIWGSEAIRESIDKHGGYVAKECLAKKLDFKGELTAAPGNADRFEINKPLFDDMTPEIAFGAAENEYKIYKTAANCA